MADRGHFGSSFAAVMAMAGSAIGLGNIWRFPYMVGQNGGAAFIIVYILSAMFICVPIFISESVIGKTAQLNTSGAFRKLAPGGKWSILAFITVLTPLIIFSFYSVVGGWSIEYLVKSVTDSFSAASTGMEAYSAEFGGFISSVWGPLICLTLFILANAVVILLGVKSGIERFTKYTTPALFVLVVVIMLYSLTLPGSSEGVLYMVKPDFSKLTASSVLSAMGQSFFSLSLGVGTILTYSSYMKREESILSTGLCTAVFDLIFALLAGFAIMPAVFAAGIEPGAGPGLIFETLPYIFSTMGASVPLLTSIIAILFFVTILFAALTSSISMLEVGVSYLVDEKKMTRRKATMLLAASCWVLAVLCSLSFGPLSGVKILGHSIFDCCDLLTSNYLMVFGSLLFVIFAGWIMKRETVRDTFTLSGRLRLSGKLFPVVMVFIRYVAPLAIAAIFLSNLLLS